MGGLITVSYPLVKWSFHVNHLPELIKLIHCHKNRNKKVMKAFQKFQPKHSDMMNNDKFISQIHIFISQSHKKKKKKGVQLTL